MGHVDADLMGPPRFQPAFHPHRGWGGAKSLDHPRPRHCMAALVEIDRLPLTVRRMARQSRGDLQHRAVFEADARRAAQTGIGTVDDAMGKRQVSALGGMRLELGGKAVMGTIGFRNDQQARRVLVDPVDDSGTLLSSDTRQGVAAMGQQGVDQCAIGRSGRGMDNHARGLVDDDQVVVLMGDNKGNRLGTSLDWFGIGNGDQVILPLGHAGLAVAHDAARAADRALGDQAGQARPRQGRRLWYRQCKRLIKPVGRIGRNGYHKVRHGSR